MSRRFTRPYAKALLQTLPNDRDAKRVRDELASYNEAQIAIPELRAMASNPAVPLEVKQRLVTEVATLLGLGREAQVFIGLLLKNFRLAHLDAVIETLDTVLNRRLGVMTADVASATALDDEQTRHLQEVLNRVLDSKVEVTLKTDPKLLGGFVARIGSYRYDASVQGQLDRMADALMQEQ